MGPSGKQDELITRYLLGDLPEREQMVIEREYFSDPEKFEEIWAVENHLVDSYVRGRLSGVERQLFEHNYLQSPDHLERVAQAELLLEAADRPAAGLHSSRAIEPVFLRWKGYLENLSDWRTLGVGLATAALLILIGVSVWLARERQRYQQEFARAAGQIAEQQQREREIIGQLSAAREQTQELGAEVERLRGEVALRPSPPTSPDRKPVLSFLLSPLLMRGGEGGGPQQITIPRDAEAIQLRMKVGQDAALRYQADISSVEGKRIWSRGGIKPSANGTIVNVSVANLPADDYILTLSSVNPQGEREEVNRYFFRAIKR